MLYAETKRKLGRDGTRAHERAEDLLTSTLFQLLRYLPMQHGLMPILQRARRFRCEDGAHHEPLIDRTEAQNFKLEPWPAWPGACPDMLIKLFNGKAQVTDVVLVEVKLYSPKSGEEGHEEEDADEPEVAQEPHSEPLSGDQLAKYWQCLERLPEVKLNDARPSIIYLTAHPLPPRDELEASLKACHRHREMRLGWLSWRDVWKIMNDVGVASSKRS